MAIVNYSSYIFYILEIISFMYTRQILLSSNPNPCLLIFVLRESKCSHLYLNWLCIPGKHSNCVLSALPFQLDKFKTVLFCSKIFNHSWLPILKSSIISTNIHELLNTNFTCYQIWISIKNLELVKWSHVYMDIDNHNIHSQSLRLLALNISLIMKGWLNN